MTLALAIALLVIASFTMAALLRLTFVGSLLAAYLIASAEIVLLAEALSLFHEIRARAVLIGEAAIAATGTALWVRVGAPRPKVPAIRARAARLHPTLLVLGIAVALALALEGVLVVTAAPNNWDAMSYHLSRAAAWYQDGSLAHLVTHTERENVFPPNAELQSLFTMVFAHGDRFAAMPQFVAELTLLIAIFGIGRRLGFGRSAAAFGALTFATLSEVVLQATSTQNDLVVSACIVTAIYFLHGSRRSELWLAGLGLGLAVGTKFTALFALPLFLLVALTVRLRRRQLVEVALASVIAFGAVGAWTYVTNIGNYGTPLGAPSVRREYAAGHSVGGAAGTYARVLYRFFDLSGMESGTATLRPTSVSVSAPARIEHRRNPAPPHQSFFLVNGRANEDVSYFGPLGGLLILPLAFGYLAAWMRRRTPTAKAVFALAIPLFLAELAFAYRYNPWVGRFMVVPVALTAVLIARVYASRELRVLVAAVGIAFLCLALVRNEQKPIGLSGGAAIWELSRPAAEALARPSMFSTLDAIQHVVPATATIGYVLGNDDWDYPLYGARLQRRIVKLPARHALARARQLGIDWVVVGGVPTKGSPGWTAIQFRDSGWSLIARTDGPVQELRRLASDVDVRTPSESGPRAARVTSSG
jgi:hypothetical protein